ncbi:MAG TPA: DUF2726 domain-containing protein [Paracoccaceae bacterium]
MCSSANPKIAMPDFDIPQFFRQFADPRTLDLLIVIAFLLAVAALSSIAGRPSSKPRRRYWYPRVVPNGISRQAPDLSDPKNQMDAIAAADFETTPLLNREEARLLPVLEAATRDFGSGHRLMVQTSLGEILRPREGSCGKQALNAAYASINSKRIDFAVFNRFGHLVAAIEYQGTGHYQNHTFMRDAVKREAVRKAGVPYIEIPPDLPVEEIRSRLRAVLQPGSQTVGKNT